MKPHGRILAEEDYMASDSTCTVVVDAPTETKAWEDAKGQINNYFGHENWIRVSAQAVSQDAAEPDAAIRVTLTAAVDQGALEWGN